VPADPISEVILFDGFELNLFAVVTIGVDCTPGIEVGVIALVGAVEGEVAPALCPNVRVVVGAVALVIGWTTGDTLGAAAATMNMPRRTDTRDLLRIG